jgi:L-fucose isomerase-like protein
MYKKRSIAMKDTNVKIVMQCKKPGQPGWPHVDFDYRAEANRILAVLEKRNPDIRFDLFLYTEVGEARRCFAEDEQHYDGLLFLEGTNWIDIDLYYIDQVRKGSKLPLVVADVPYGGSGETLKVKSIVEAERLPVPVISSADLDDLADAVHVFRTLHMMSQTKVLVISDREEYARFVEPAKTLFGCDFVVKGSKDVLEAFGQADDREARNLAASWISESQKVLEPSEEEIFKSAKLYGGLMHLMRQCGADALTVDCLGLYYVGDAPAYPCMTFFQMQREGKVGVCEADIDATVSSLLAQYGTGRPGFVSDPFLDTHANRIVYAHCTYCDKPFGKEDPRSCPFYLRSHAEDRKGVAVQSMLPVEEPLTTIKVSLLDTAASIHSGTSKGNVTEESGCRTKLSAEVPAKKLLKNWHYEKFSWHRVTVFGDYREFFTDLFAIKGLELVEEDEA